MNSFTISDMQKYSGIKAHTIRIWEKRYNALKPGRSEGNTRYYDGSQLRRLLNIVSLLESDYKISELGSMTDEKINKLIAKSLAHTSVLKMEDLLISQIIASALEYNEPLFERIFSHSLIRFGIKGTYIKVLYPTMQRLGIMWSENTLPPAQEHFVTNLIRQKLQTAIDALPHNETEKNSWILFLPEDEFHETGLLLSSYLLRMSGMKVYYLGANVPIESLKEVVRSVNASNLLFFLIGKKDTAYQHALVRKIHKQFPTQKIYVAGEKTQLSKTPNLKNLVRISSVDDFEKIIRVQISN